MPRRTDHGDVRELIPADPDLEQLRDVARGCTGCPLYATLLRPSSVKVPPTPRCCWSESSPVIGKMLPDVRSWDRPGACSTTPSSGRDRSPARLRHQHRQALQVGRTRQEAHPQEAELERDQGVHPVARGRDRRREAARSRVPGGDRGAGVARLGLQGHPAARRARRLAPGSDRHGDGAPLLDPAWAGGRAPRGARSFHGRPLARGARPARTTRLDLQRPWRGPTSKE